MRAKNITPARAKASAFPKGFGRTGTSGRIVPVVLAALLLGAAGASVPVYAEIQSSNGSNPVLVPAGIQQTAEQALVSPTVPEDAAADDAGPRFEDPGTPIEGGTASFYGNEFAGHRTASGAAFDPTAFTAAHRSLPFGSKVRVTNSRTGASVIVTINDRGPFSRNRVIDVSKAAARELGLIGPGSGKVSLAVLGN